MRFKMTSQLTEEQLQAVKKFVEAVTRSRKRRCDWRAAVKFLCARKWDVGRALALFDQHELTRLREGLLNLDPAAEPLKSELNTGKFTVLPTRDSSGAAIAVFTARIHTPQTSSHQTTLQGLVYQLDVALESAETQKAGIVFIYDMSGSKYSHFDYDLSQKILTLLKGGYPAKLKKVLIVTAPLWFKAPFKILRLFVREKLRDRVFTVSIPQLSVHIPRESLPVGLGGVLEVAHHAWLLHCSKSMANRASPSRLSAISTIENEVESPPISETEEVQPAEPWQPTTEPAGSPLALSSASSGFSDDDSLHCDSPGGLSLADFIQRVRSLGKAGLTLEYSEIKARPPHGTFNHSKLKGNQVKNRYTDVLCYDHSRVLLSIEDDDPTSDYINANFVDGYKQKNAFISTQGPLLKTCTDFWRMVWEQGSVVVVMTTRTMERGRQKCWQYWAPEAGGSQSHGGFLLTTLSVETRPEFVISVLELVNTQTEEKRRVEHLQYTSWPDYGVPESAEGMLGFLQLVRSSQERLTAGLGDTWAGHPRGPPVVVHCSAGIGRTEILNVSLALLCSECSCHVFHDFLEKSLDMTSAFYAQLGTFCTLDICISRLDETGTVDVRGTVERIRTQRAFSIQMPDQYIFCHVALIEYAVSKGLTSPVDLSLLLADRDSD